MKHLDVQEECRDSNARRMNQIKGQALEKDAIFERSNAEVVVHQLNNLLKFVIARKGLEKEIDQDQEIILPLEFRKEAQ